jgi:membrane protein implicated in regulation of membrane protease activity
MRNVVFCLLIAAASTIGIAGEAAAYVGPGAGLSLIGAFWGLVVAVVAALSFIIIWPFRRMFRKARRDRVPTTPQGDLETQDRAS